MDPEEEKKERFAVRIRVWGNVQGVFFRSAVEDAARSCRVKGYVKNNRNETVEIEAEGTSEDMQRFLAKVREGSDMSVVKRMRVIEQEPKDYDAFRIQ